MRKVGATIAFAFLAAGMLVALPSHATVAQAAPTPPVASPAAPLKNERFSLTGTLTTKFVRPVQLQAKSGKKWKKIGSGKTDKAGRYALTASTQATSITVRVVAPKVKVKGKKYKSITTRSRTIRPASAQSARLTMPATAQVTEAVNASLTFVPARARRPVQLEALVSGSWTKVATGFETNTGTTVIQLTATTIGTFSYRATAPAWNGAPSVSSSPTQLTVTASHVSVPDTTRPLTDAEVAAVTSYDATTGAVVLTNPPQTITSVVAGDAITIPPRNGAASGALRRITKVATSGAVTTLSTEEVSLPEVIENIPDDAASVGLSLLSSSFEPTDGVTVETTPVASQSVHGAGVRAASVGELKLALDAQAKSDPGLYLKLKGGVSIVPRSQLELNIDWFRLKSYKIGAGVQVNNSVSAEVGLTGKAKLFSLELGVLNQVLYGAIGPVPVWVQITLNLVAEVDVSGTVSVTATVTQTGTTMGGIQSTSDSDLTPKFYTSSAASTSKLVKVTAAGSLDAFVGPQLEIALYSLGGLYGKLGAQAKADLSVSTTDGWKCSLKYGPHAEVGVKTSDAIKKLTGIEFKAGAKIDFTAAELDVCPDGTGEGGGGDPGGSALSISTTSLPAATVGTAYSVILAAAGGTAPYSWTASGLPDGLSLSSSGGLSGTPSGAGEYQPTLTVTDGAGAVSSRALAIVVAASTSITAPPVSAGSAHTCAITSTGAAKCWGDNEAGQLGNGTTTNSSTPVQVTGLTSGVVAIAAGGDHTCAITNTGAAKCWGGNEAGQLGNGTTTNSSTPVQVTGLTSGVASISAGAAYTCAVTSTGAAKCWGYNGDGQLGDGTGTSRTTPVQVTGLTSGVAGIAVSPDGYNGYFTCAITGGAAKCWGNNTYGQLGNTGGSSSTPVQVTGVDSLATAITVGAEHSCVMLSGGAAKCWGYDQVGQLGNGVADRHRVLAVQVAGLDGGVTAITAGDIHTCSIVAGGEVECWGDNASGQIGIRAGNGGGSRRLSLRPTQVDGLAAGVTAVDAGINHTCAVTGSGAVTCWGDNQYGQLGNGATTTNSQPAPVPGLTVGTTAIAAGSGYTCSIVDGAAKCWGANDSGQLGENSTNDSSSPTQVAGLTSGVTGIAVGASHTCATTSAGAALCWGTNQSGRLGTTGGDSSSPVQVTGLSSGVSAVSVGSGHTCAIAGGGAAKCWGDNQYGQLGDGTTTSRDTPVPVTGLDSGVVAISAGYDHTCGITSGGAAKCWGSNQYGQLGDGTTTNSNTPVAVTGLDSGVIAISAGEWYTCAITSGGAAKCWGSNQYGQLGDGTTTNSSAPVQVAGLGSSTAVIAASVSYLVRGHTCAVTSSGAVKCWGDNHLGQLGDGTTTSRYTPVGVTHLDSGVVAVSAGAGHTCAITSAGSAECWGSNSYGQLGTPSGRTPVDVIGLE